MPMHKRAASWFEGKLLDGRFGGFLSRLLLLRSHGRLKAVEGKDAPDGLSLRQPVAKSRHFPMETGLHGPWGEECPDATRCFALPC